MNRKQLEGSLVILLIFGAPYFQCDVSMYRMRGEQWSSVNYLMGGTANDTRVVPFRGHLMRNVTDPLTLSFGPSCYRFSTRGELLLESSWGSVDPGACSQTEPIFMAGYWALTVSVIGGLFYVLFWRGACGSRYSVPENVGLVVMVMGIGLMTIVYCRWRSACHDFAELVATEIGVTPGPGPVEVALSDSMKFLFPALFCLHAIIFLIGLMIRNCVRKEEREWQRRNLNRPPPVPDGPVYPDNDAPYRDVPTDAQGEDLESETLRV